MKALFTALKGQGPAAQLGQAVRAFGAVVPAEGNPFLRYSNPFPVAIDHTPLLSTVPETRVRRHGPLLARRCHRGSRGRSTKLTGAVLVRR
jgi:hypothetical protein